MTPKDLEEYHNLERLRVFKAKGYDEFTVQFHHETKELVFLVNDAPRNRIIVEDPDSKFEACLSAVKSLFLSWRNLVN